MLARPCSLTPPPASLALPGEGGEPACCRCGLAARLIVLAANCLLHDITNDALSPTAGIPPPSAYPCRLEVEVAVEGSTAAALEGLAVHASLYRCNAAGEVDPAGGWAGMVLAYRRCEGW
jgi:hypothetical protein